MPQGKETTSKTQKLTLKQERLLEALPKSASVSEAGEKAGYAYAQDSHRALKSIAERAPEVLDRIGLTIEHVAEKCLKPLLEANRTEFFASDGIVFDKKEVPDNGTRIRAIDVWAKLRGAYATQKLQLSGDVSVDLNHVSDDELARIITSLVKPSEPATKA
jgi:hypothetical protein